MNLHFVIPGPPVPWQRPRPKWGSVSAYFTPRKSMAYQKHVAIHGRAASIKQHRGKWPTTARYDLTLRIFFPDKRTRDDDNVEKNIKDGLTKVLWDDDKWTTFRKIEKWMALDRDKPRVEVSVEVVK